MKTHDLKQLVVEQLVSDECKYGFLSSLKSIFEEHDPMINSVTAQALYFEIKNTFPSLLKIESFDSKKIRSTEYIRYKLISEGHVPVDLDCLYDDYEYIDLDDMSDSELKTYYNKITRKMRLSAGNMDLLNFLQFIKDACTFYCSEEDRLTYVDSYNVKCLDL